MHLLATLRVQLVHTHTLPGRFMMEPVEGRGQEERQTKPRKHCGDVISSFPITSSGDEPHPPHGPPLRPHSASLSAVC